jgi:hypothetical protein
LQVTDIDHPFAVPGQGSPLQIVLSRVALQLALPLHEVMAAGHDVGLQLFAYTSEAAVMVDPLAHVRTQVCPSPLMAASSATHVVCAGHVLPHGIDEAHVPKWHEPDAQSAAYPHTCPSAHPGEHEGGAAQNPAVQMFDTQSPLRAQAAPCAHDGEHAGGAHVPPVQTPERQSPAAPQT